MHIIKTTEFERSFKKLPTDIKRLCKEREHRILANSRDPRLHLKKLHGLEGVYSFRVMHSYRGLFYFDDKGYIILFEIDNRKDIYK